MKPAAATVIMLMLALAACGGDPAPVATGSDTADAASTAIVDDQPVDDQPAADVPPATAPMPAYTAGMARFDGYGDVRFGIDAEAVEQAWGGELTGEPGEGEVCYYLSPARQNVPASFAFMIENGRFVRYDVGNDTEIAPGGGQRAMSAEQIHGLYEGRVEEQDHKYVEGGRYLRIADPDGGDGVLIFETDAAEIVSEWRVGVPPQVDYVEGCS